MASDPAAQQLHLGPDDVERALTAVFVHGATPDAALGDPAARDAVMRNGLEQLASRVGAPITPDQAAEAIQLLSTGEFFGDLASTVAAAAFAVRNLPIDLVHDVGHMPHRMIALVGALAMDLAGTPFIPLRVLEDLLADGKLDHPPAVLSHTMKCLLGFATLGTTAQTISDLIAPDNRSVRLAIVIYARANGIPLEESDLDLLRAQVLDTPNPDLGPVLVAAMSRFIDRSGKGQVLATMQQLAASRPRTPRLSGDPAVSAPAAARGRGPRTARSPAPQLPCSRCGLRNRLDVRGPPSDRSTLGRRRTAASAPP